MRHDSAGLLFVPVACLIFLGLAVYGPHSGAVGSYDSPRDMTAALYGASEGLVRRRLGPPDSIRPGGDGSRCQSWRYERVRFNDGQTVPVRLEICDGRVIAFGPS